MNELDQGKRGTKPYLRSRDDAQAMWGMGALWVMMATSDDTGGRFSMMDQTCAKGAGPGPHKHLWADEMIYILEGEITFLLGDEMHTGKAGSMAFIPRNTRHGFRVDSDTARILNFYNPGGQEASALLNLAPAEALTLPPAGFKHAPNVAMGELFETFGHVAETGPNPLKPE